MFIRSLLTMTVAVCLAITAQGKTDSYSRLIVHKGDKVYVAVDDAMYLNRADLVKYQKLANEPSVAAGDAVSRFWMKLVEAHKASRLYRHMVVTVVESSHDGDFSQVKVLTTDPEVQDVFGTEFIARRLCG
jgi:hypothetical protein